YYGLSPLPSFTLPAATFAPPGYLSPSYYYHYYIANGLSNSYHDLSQLQQKNMMSIMKRSGFISGSDQDQDPDIDRKLEKIENSKSNANDTNGQHGQQKIVHTEEIDGTSKKMKRSKNDKDENEKNLRKQESSKQLEPEPLTTMERSFSMPSIRTESSTENDQHLHSSQNTQDNTQVISEEVIKELGMWEQVIQEEKNQQSSGNIVFEQSTEDSNNVKQHRPSTLLPQEQSAMIARDKQLKTESKPVKIPTVNIQPSTPSVQSTFVKGNFESSAVPLEQSSSSLPPPHIDNEADQQNQSASTVELKRQESIKNVESSDKQAASKQENVDSKLPQTTVKSKLPTVTKTGPAAPTASRRMSKPAQQLYIKTTPAIPMNANIQHILGNVARTEGPFDNPYDAVKAAVIALRDHAWTTKVEGMLAVVRLATFHPHHLIRDQHQISLALASETRNLRSTVARSAIFTIGELFTKLRSQIESELDILTQALLHKVSENSVFIREDIDRALQLMIESMPQTRAALALITFGSRFDGFNYYHFLILTNYFTDHISHRNTHVRRTSAQFISSLVEKMGPMKCLLGPRDIGEHLLPAAARFIQDQSSHTRYFGRRIFATLMQHPLFDKLLRRHVSPGTYRNICGMLETIKRRGVGDPPSDLYSPTVQPKDSDPRRLIIVEATTPS
ncbi:protein FAM179B-like protein, partial [Euroglyphus maynei]